MARRSGTDDDGTGGASASLNPDSIPEELRERKQWVLWRNETRDGKQTKVPYVARAPKDRGQAAGVQTAFRASATDPSTWRSFGEAVYLAREGDWGGVGYVFSADDPFTGVDFDACFDEHGELHPDAARIVETLDSYSERSPSRTGLHVFVRADLNGHPRNRTDKVPWGGGIEIYSTGRYFTMTGNRLEDTPDTVEERQAELDGVLAELLPKPAANGAAPVSSRAGARASDDHELLARAFKADNGAKLQALYEGDVAGHKSGSEADLALAGMLAFWTGPDPDRIERLLRSSKLVRNKWDEHRTYLRDTIDKALEGRTEFWGGAKRELTDLTVEDILKAAGIDDTGDIESAKDLLAALKGGRKVADRVVELVEEAGVQLFHDENRIAYAVVEIDGHVETHRVKSREFSLWVRNLYHQREESVLSTQARKDAEGLLEAKAVFNGETAPVHLRVAGDDGVIYIDLGDDAWRAIRIKADGWEVLARHPVRFRRTGGMAPLPIPVPAGTLDDLCDLLNLESDTDRKLVLAWLLGAARPGVPYPVLELTGEEGTAKSTAARAVRAMIDPSTTPLRRCPTKSDDLYVAANASWVAAFDNVSDIQQWMSDDLCRLATGGGQSKRELFTDEGEHLIDVRRPVLINGIEGVATRGDLLRRTLSVELPVIEDEERLTEAEFWGGFDALHPRLLGALCDALACALKRVDEVELAGLPSMADLALWVTAAEPALGWQEGAFSEGVRGAA